MESGAVRCWGSGSGGQLGYGSAQSIGNNINQMPPADVNLGGAIAALAVGSSFNCVLMQSGEVRCWGDNAYGQLGRARGRPTDWSPFQYPRSRNCTAH